MSRQQVLQVGIAVILVVSFLVGCGGGAPTAVSEAPAVTPTPKPPTLTPTPEPPTATSTPEPPTATLTPPTATSVPPKPTLELPLARLEAFTGVKMIRLVVEQSYPQLEEDFSIPIADTSQRILERVGFEVVDETATQYDASLFITVTGQALSASYIPVGTMYTGAELEGDLSMLVPGAEPYNRSLSAQVSPPESVSYSKETKPTEPKQAPFEALEWQQPFFLALHDLWGPQPVISALEDESPLVRMAAASALGDIGPELGVVPALMGAMGDDDEAVGARVAAALVRISGPKLVPDLIEALQDEDNTVRANAANALGMIGPEAKDAVPHLIELLKDENYYVQDNVIHALEQIDPETGVIFALIKTMEGKTPIENMTAVQALGRIGPKAVPALIEAMQDEDSSMRESAIYALWWMQPQTDPEATEVVLALIKALGDENSDVRVRAADALGQIGPKASAAVPALIEALKDEDSSVRKSAAEALGKIGSETSVAVPALIKALKDEDSSVGSAAAYSLQQIGPEASESVPALIEALGDEALNYWATFALEAITGQDFGEDAGQWKKWWDAQK